MTYLSFGMGRWNLTEVRKVVFDNPQAIRCMCDTIIGYLFHGSPPTSSVSYCDGPMYSTFPHTLTDIVVTLINADFVITVSNLSSCFSWVLIFRDKTEGRFDVLNQKRNAAGLGQLLQPYHPRRCETLWLDCPSLGFNEHIGNRGKQGGNIHCFAETLGKLIIHSRERQYTLFCCRPFKLVHASLHPDRKECVFLTMKNMVELNRKRELTTSKIVLDRMGVGLLDKQRQRGILCVKSFFCM